MAEENIPTENPEVQGKSIKQMGGDLFNAIKTPVFYLAIGYFTCKFMDRKKT